MRPGQIYRVGAIVFDSGLVEVRVSIQRYGVELDSVKHQCERGRPETLTLLVSTVYRLS